MNVRIIKRAWLNLDNMLNYYKSENHNKDYDFYVRSKEMYYFFGSLQYPPDIGVDVETQIKEDIEVFLKFLVINKFVDSEKSSALLDLIESEDLSAKELAFKYLNTLKVADLILQKT